MDDNKVLELDKKLADKHAKKVVEGRAMGSSTVGVKAEDRQDKMELDLKPQDGKEVLQAKVDAMTDVELIKYLQGSHKSDVHIVLREFISNKRKATISRTSPLMASELKTLTKQAMESYTHDHKCPTNIDVDKIATYLYQTFLKMLKVQQDEINVLTDRLDKLTGVEVNNVEE